MKFWRWLRRGAMGGFVLVLLLVYVLAPSGGKDSGMPLARPMPVIPTR